MTTRIWISALALLLGTLVISDGTADARFCRCRGGWRHQGVFYNNTGVYANAGAVTTAQPVMNTNQQPINNPPVETAPAPPQPPAQPTAPAPANNANPPAPGT